MKKNNLKKLLSLGLSSFAALSIMFSGIGGVKADSNNDRHDNGDNRDDNDRRDRNRDDREDRDNRDRNDRDRDRDRDRDDDRDHRDRDRDEDRDHRDRDRDRDRDNDRDRNRDRDRDNDRDRDHRSGEIRIESVRVTNSTAVINFRANEFRNKTVTAIVSVKENSTGLVEKSFTTKIDHNGKGTVVVKDLKSGTSYDFKVRIETNGRSTSNSSDREATTSE